VWRSFQWGVEMLFTKIKGAFSKWLNPGRQRMQDHLAISGHDAVSHVHEEVSETI